MSSNGKKAIILILLCVVIAVVPLIAIKDSEFGGSDDAASQAISQLTGEEEYTPWFSLFTSLQAGKQNPCYSVFRQLLVPVSLAMVLVY